MLSSDSVKALVLRALEAFRKSRRNKIKALSNELLRSDALPNKGMSADGAKSPTTSSRYEQIKLNETKYLRRILAQREAVEAFEQQQIRE